jgi:hypothetical protein
LNQFAILASIGLSTRPSSEAGPTETTPESLPVKLANEMTSDGCLIQLGDCCRLFAPFDNGTGRFSRVGSLKFETVSSGRSYRGRTYIVPVNWRHSFSAAARRLSI